MSALTVIRHAGLYGRTAVRVAQRGWRESGSDPELATERPVFVVGSPRSGTTFLAGAVGAQPGFVDLGEVRPVKASIERWRGLPVDAAARELRATVERVRRLAFVRDLRPVEQTPETSFVVSAVVRAYPPRRAPSPHTRSRFATSKSPPTRPPPRTRSPRGSRATRRRCARRWQRCMPARSGAGSAI
jgi:hypothetical protein